MAYFVLAFATYLSTHCERTGWKDNFLLSGSGWAAVMIAVAGLVNMSYLFTRSDPVFPLVYIWACAAIYTGHRKCLCSNTRAQAGSVPGCLSCVVPEDLTTMTLLMIPLLLVLCLQAMTQW
jgi:hypothetical protein